MPGYLPGKQTRIWRSVALALLVGLLALFSPHSASAAPTAINSATAELQALSDLVDQLSMQLEAAAEDYNYANQQYEDTKTAADKASAELTKADADLASAQALLEKRLVGMYESGDMGTLDALMGSGSFTEFLASLDQFQTIAEADTRLISEVKAYKSQQAELRAKLDADLKQLQTYKDQANDAKQKVLAQLERQKQALKGKEVQLAQLRKAEAERQARLAAEERARRIWLATRPGKVVTMSRQYLGVPYVWGGSSPRGFDCSGLVKYVYAKVGVSLPHSSRMMFNLGKPVARADLRAGDLVFFFTPIAHVGIYIGNGKMINATGTRVQISDVWPNSYRGARRVL